jgi:hypothetical protein
MQRFPQLLAQRPLPSPLPPCPHRPPPPNPLIPGGITAARLIKQKPQQSKRRLLLHSPRLCPPLTHLALKLPPLCCRPLTPTNFTAKCVRYPPPTAWRQRGQRCPFPRPSPLFLSRSHSLQGGCIGATRGECEGEGRALDERRRWLRVLAVALPKPVRREQLRLIFFVLIISAGGERRWARRRATAVQSSVVLSGLRENSPIHSRTHARTHARTYTHTHTQTHTHALTLTHTPTHTQGVNGWRQS